MSKKTVPNGAPTDLQEPVTPQPSVTLDDLQAGAAPVENPAPEIQPEPATAMTEEQILGLIGFLTSMGLPREAVATYQQELLANPLLAMFLPMLELPELLAKYGIGGGSGGPMPDWMRGTLAAGLIGYVVFTTRSQYAIRPERKEESVPDAGFAAAADSVPTGFAANISEGGVF